jgi:hypothetical protein
VNRVEKAVNTPVDSHDQNAQELIAAPIVVDEQIDLPDDTGPRSRVVLTLLLPVAVALFAAFYTNQIWEDYFITVRHSMNLCRGNGLTFQPGTHVHGFTSPLGVLLPALCNAVIPGDSGAQALWLFRFLSIAAYAGGCLLVLLGLTRSHRTRAWCCLALTAILYSSETKMVMFTINGMETGFMLLFTALAIWVMAADPARKAWVMGFAWAGMMWSRPDSCVYITAMGLALLLFPNGSRKRMAIAILKAAAVCTLLYLPWFLWAWSYYGSPVPHTVIAKGTAGFAPGAVFTRLLGILPRSCLIFLPAYAEHGGWEAYTIFAGSIGLLSVSYWAVPRGDVCARRTSLMALLGLVYLTAIPRTFPWYWPTTTVLALPGIAAWLRLGKEALPGKIRNRAAFALLTGAVLAQGLMLARATQDARLSQEQEWRHRRIIGLWLRENAAPQDRVFLECVGYIGYFSELPMLDYPGLVSPAVVASRRRVGDDMAKVGMDLQPEWMVLRPSETRWFEAIHQGWLTEHYELVNVFDSTDSVKAAAGGREVSYYDAVFFALRRRPQPSPPSNTP